MRGDQAALVTWPTSLHRRRRKHDRASGRHRRVGDLALHAHQPLRHPPAAAMQHANDDFLADVTALGLTDGALEQAGLERNGLRRSCRRRTPAVPASMRIASITSADTSAAPAFSSAAMARSASSRGDHHIPTALVRIIRARHEPAAHIDLRPQGQAAHGLAAHTRRAGNRLSGSLAHDRNLPQRRRHVGHADVLREDEPVERLQPARRPPRRARPRSDNRADEHVQVGDQAALRRQIERVSAAARRERRDLVASAARGEMRRDPRRRNRSRPRACFSAQPASAAMMRY